MKNSLLQRLMDLVAFPSRLMDHVGEAPRFLIPGLLVVVITGVFTYATLPISGPEQMEVMRDSKISQLIPEDAWQQQYDQAMSPTPVKRAVQGVFSGLAAWASIIIFGLILGFFVRMGGGQGTMKQALGVVSWASLIPFGLGVLIKLPLVMMTESVFSVTIGLAAFAPGDDPTSPLHQILQSYGDFFTWWGLVILVIGFSRVFKLSTRSAAVSVLLPWALATAVPVAIGLIVM
ncbi:hypothetical protein GW813_01540 [bacterium]|nr:hypothetical protein [bacterium]PJA76022.1 MAG: hypothetical protein CO151_04150 [bacterium CG_4_9_14_3_um_filter_65_15]